MDGYQPRVDDIVRVGSGKKLWRVTERFWADRVAGQRAALTDTEVRAISLKPVEGYTSSSAEVERLTLVSRPGPSQGGPRRLQLRRTKGWRKPAGAVVVARPSRWGNPYIVSEHQTRQEAVENYRQALLDGRLQNSPGRVRRELAGLDLLCWCPLEDHDGKRVPCHADVLLEIANSDAPERNKS